jgi:hydrophobic/amphiphilic exporter-1 (mainly G- bacteria), HAE1 family
LMQGGRTRVRPIVMTAIATMLALVPLGLGLSQGEIIASELATVVIGGLFTSTFLTLIVVPVVYSLVDDLKQMVRRRRGVTGEVEAA